MNTQTGDLCQLRLTRFAVFIEGVSKPYFVEVASKEVARRFFENQGMRVHSVCVADGGRSRLDEEDEAFASTPHPSAYYERTEH